MFFTDPFNSIRIFYHLRVAEVNFPTYPPSHANPSMVSARSRSG